MGGGDLDVGLGVFGVEVGGPGFDLFAGFRFQEEFVFAAEVAGETDGGGDAGFGEADVFGAESELSAGRGGEGFGERGFGWEEVEFADEGGDEGGGGAGVDFDGGADLFDTAVAHDGDAAGEGKGFFLIVGDVEAGDAGFGVEALDFGAHVVAEFGVEIGERFVEEEEIGVDDDGAGEGDALLLSAGKGGRFALGEGVHFHFGEGGLDAGLEFGGGRFADAEAVGDVFENGEVGPEGVVLEDEGGVALVGGDFVDAAVAETDFAGIGFEESGEEAEDGGFSAAGGAEEEEHFSGLDFEIDAVDDGVAVELFDEAGENDLHSARDAVIRRVCRFGKRRGRRRWWL